MVWLLEFLLQEGEVLYDSCAVTSVAVAHARHFNWILHSLGLLDDVVSLDARIATEKEKFGIAGIFDHADFSTVGLKLSQLLFDHIVCFSFNLLAGQVVLRINHFVFVCKEHRASRS